MKLLRFALVAAVLLVAACASTPAVYTDFDPGVNFAEYRTYRWTQKPEGFSPLAQQRLIAAVDAKLRERGWTQSTDPQVNLVGSVAHETRYRMDTYNDYPYWGGWGWAGCCWGGPGWGWGGGYSSSTLRAYTYGTLVLDMYDAHTQRPLWRGIAMGVVPDAPAAQTSAMQISIDRMFAQFPPGATAPLP